MSSLTVVYNIFTVVSLITRLYPTVGDSGDYTYNASPASRPDGRGSFEIHGTCSTSDAQSPINVVKARLSLLKTIP